YQTQPELSKYHTYDLLLLLSYLREQRSTAYKTMQSVRKAPNEVKTSRNDYDELNEYGQEFYREATARKNIIEQILIDRDRKSTRLNSSHVSSSYAVFCLKKTRTTHR